MNGCTCGDPYCNGPTDFVVKQGADWSETQTLVDSTGNPINLTGAAAVLTARPYPGQPSPAIALSTTAGSITLGGTAGTVAWTLPGAQTALLVPALNTPVGFQPTGSLRFLAYYDLVVTSAGAIVSYRHGKLLMLLGIMNPSRTDGEIVLPTFP